ncbi:hypothetical protein Vafri_10567 [Volvox africanus]|uniref:Uncharacterized protein n=1 Tax=Volvox africanus TaxID=51714 RepID=A0A8J4BAH8_9CHLO|nr:hypothetical protein Vafri_10567 [Volvox africanus]
MDSNYDCYGSSGASYPPPGPADPNIPTAYAPGASQFRPPPSWQSMDSSKGRIEQTIPAAQPPTLWYAEPPSWDPPASGQGITTGSGPQMPQPVYQPGPGPGPGLTAGPESTSAPSNAAAYYGSNGWTWDGRQWRPGSHTGRQYYGSAGGQQQGGVGNGVTAPHWTGWNGQMWEVQTEHSGGFAAAAHGCNNGSGQMQPPYYHHPPTGSGQEPPAPQPLQPQTDIFAAGAEPYGQIVLYHPAHPASSQPPLQNGVSRRRGSESPGHPKGCRPPSHQPASCRPPWNPIARGGRGGPQDAGFPPAPFKLTGKRSRPALNSYVPEPQYRSVVRFQAVTGSGETAARAHRGVAHRGVGAHDRPGSTSFPKLEAAVGHPLAKITFWVQALPKGVKPDPARGASAVMAAVSAAKAAAAAPRCGWPLPGPLVPSASGDAGGSQQPRHLPALPWSQAAQDHPPTPGPAAVSGALSQPLHDTAPLPPVAPVDPSCTILAATGAEPSCDPEPAALRTADLSSGGGHNPTSDGPPTAADESQVALAAPGLQQEQQRQPQAHEQQLQAQPSDAGRPPSSNLRLRRQGLMLSLGKRLSAQGEAAQGPAAASSSPTGSPASAPVG